MQPDGTLERQTVERQAVERRPIEIGWVYVGLFDENDRQVLRQARRDMIDRLQSLFPQYRWRAPRVERRAAAAGFLRRRPDELLDIAADERDLHHWDFTLVVTDADLVTFTKPFALGTPSRAMNAAVMSTSRILSDGDDLETVNDADLGARRLTALALHLFGHLAHLDNEDEDVTDYMFELAGVDDLDHMSHFPEHVREDLEEHLGAVADERLEETGRFHGRAWRFYMHVAWHLRRDIWSAVARVEPWMFPLRFGRLTTAAASALVVLGITAESWELGLSQPPARVATLAISAIVFLAFLLLRRQRLLLIHRGRQLSEQRVAANIAITVAMIVGLALTYALLFAAVYVSAEVLFSRPLINSWAPSLGHPVGVIELASFSGFVAFLGLIVGALGASFEEQGYFRHITLVDEET